MHERTPIAGDVYLPPESARGARYCLDPSSAALRAAIKQPPISAATHLDRGALARDVSVLHGILAKQYAGYAELLQHRSFDVGAFFARWSNEVLSHPGTVSFGDGVIRYLVELKKQHPDRHLQPHGWGAALASERELEVVEYQALTEHADIAQCHGAPGSGLIFDTLRRSELVTRAGSVASIVTISTRGAVAPTLELECGAHTLSLVRRGEVVARVAGSLPVYELEAHGQTAILHVRSLSGSPEQRQLLERIAHDYDQHRTYETLVFDFRGNGGGDDGYIFQWIDRAKRGSFQLWPSIEIEGALFPCRDWNSLVYLQIAYGTVDEEESVAARAKLRERWPLEVAGIRHRVSPGTVTADAEHPYPGRIIVLVDRHSLSSGESAPAALRAAFGAILVGERTGGFLEYGNLQPMVLPYTGLLFWIPIARHYLDPPGESVGLAVDYYLEPALLKSPAKDLLPLLRPLVGPGR